MVLLHVPVFVLAPAAQLPLEPAGFEVLLDLQGQHVGAADRVRLFALPGGWQGSLDALIGDSAAGLRPFCDALVPALAIDSLSLGVYELIGSASGTGPGPGASRWRRRQRAQRFPAGGGSALPRSGAPAGGAERSLLVLSH